MPSIAQEAIVSHSKQESHRSRRAVAPAPRKIFFRLLPSSLECLRTLRSYFRHSKSNTAYAVFTGNTLRYWSTTQVGADNWAARTLLDAYTTVRVGRNLMVQP